ncbi:MAG TPA: hypothetical protein VEK84_09580 [Terriglobales bacterium]|nr:hypothetical protein [Terriglobales bacterium]
MRQHSRKSNIGGVKAGTSDGDRLVVLITLVEAYEREHLPIDVPNPIEKTGFGRSAV